MIYSRVLFNRNHKNIAFAFDIDGVLLRGQNPIKKAGEALNLLNQNKIPFVLLTNGGGKLEKERTAFISSQLNVPISPLQIIQSHTPYKALTNKYSRILAVGTPSVREVAEKYGFRDVVHTLDIVRYDRSITPFSGTSDSQLMQYSRPIPDLDSKKFDAILVFNDPHDWAADIQIIVDLLISENGFLNTLRSERRCKPSIPIYFSNNDLLWANAYQLNRFGQGAFRKLVKALYASMNNDMSLEDFILGKPTKITYDYAHHVLIDWYNTMCRKDKPNNVLPELGKSPKESPFSDVYMIGDNPASDIIGAKNYGWSSCLVKTGVYRDTDDLNLVRPTMIVSDVHEAVTKVLERNGY